MNRPMKNIFGLLFLALLSLTAPVSAQEEDAREIFAALEPSLVAITNAEGGGSGVVLSEKGLIITNFHVANTPLPLTVEAFVTEGGKSVRKTFTDVALFKVHKSSDLALLIIKAPGVSFKPAPISKAEKDTAAGGTCFALGYPFVPDQDKPTLTITKGIISSARRIVGGNPYIQLDAAINPGNSGGALANDKGIVIGIPTLKFEGADRIGLAAPLASLKMDQFVDISERKGDPKEAARLAEMAQNLLIRNLLTFGTDRRVVEIAVFLQREALALEPNNPKWSFDLSSMYFQLEEFTIAAAYSEAAVRLAPDNFPSRTLLADCYNELGETEKAIVQRLECLEFRSTTKDGRKEWAEAIALLARDCAATNRPVQAVYALSWSRSVLTRTQSFSLPTASGKGWTWWAAL